MAAEQPKWALWSANSSLRSMSVQDRVGHAGDLHHFSYVMNAKNMCATEDAGGDCSGSAPQPLIGGRGLAVFGKSSAQEGFSRRADQQRIAEFRESEEIRQQFVILRVGFAKADAGVEDDLGFGNTGAPRESDGAPQGSGNITDGIFGEWALLHRLRGAAHVHQDQRNFVTDGNLCDTGIVLQTGNVI